VLVSRPRLRQNSPDREIAPIYFSQSLLWLLLFQPGQKRNQIMEIAQQVAQLKDFQQRLDALRGYL